MLNGDKTIHSAFLCQQKPFDGKFIFKVCMTRNFWAVYFVCKVFNKSNSQLKDRYNLSQ